MSLPESPDPTDLRPGLVIYGHPNDGEPPPATKPPRKFTKGLAESICRYIRCGHHPETAAEMCGISAAEFRHWVQLGNEGDPYLETFAMQVANAAAHAEAEISSFVFDEAKKNAAIGIKWLERQRPKRWNKQVDVIIQGEVTKLMNLLEARMTPTAFNEVLRVLSEAAGAGETAPSPER